MYEKTRQSMRVAATVKDSVSLLFLALRSPSLTGAYRDFLLSINTLTLVHRFKKE